MPGLAAIQRHQPFSVTVSHRLGDAVTDLAGTVDDAWLIAATASGRLARFDRAGKPLNQWQAHDGGVIRIRLQPQGGGTIASAGEDGRVVLWDCADASESACLLNESGWVEHLEWTPDGSVLAVAARKTLSFWKGTDPLGMWFDAKRQILAMNWAPDGRRLATGSNKGLYLWRVGRNDSEPVDPVQLLSFPGAAVAVAWQPAGQALAVGTQDGFLQVWLAGTGTAQGARQLTMKGYPSKVACLAWHPSRSTIASAGGNDVVLWQLPRRGGNATGQPLRHHAATVTALQWAGSGNFLASGDRSGRVCIWNTNGDAIFSQGFDREITVLRWCARDDQLQVGDVGGGLHLLKHVDATTRPLTASARKPS